MLPLDQVCTFPKHKSPSESGNHGNVTDDIISFHNVDFYAFCTQKLSMDLGSLG